MKLTKNRLRQIIAEEILKEQEVDQANNLILKKLSGMKLTKPFTIKLKREESFKVMVKNQIAQW